MSLLQTRNKLVVEASRDHGKSFLFSYSWPLWNIQRKGVVGENIALISYSEDQARKNLVRIRKAIETNPSLRWLMPKSKAYVWDAQSLNCSNDATIETFGFGSSIRGGHYHRVIVDDPTKDNVSMSMADQENFFYGAIVPAVRREGQIVVCGNPVAKQDLLEKLERNSEFETYFYPCINPDGTALWPAQWDLESLRAKQRLMPAHYWAREYLLKRVNAADAKFKEEWIHYYTDFPKNVYTVMTIDPAFSPGGDALAAVVTGTDAKDDTYVLDRFSFRGDFNIGIGKLCDMMKLYRPQKIGCESFAFQKMYKVLLQKEMEKRKIYFNIEEVGRDTKKSKAMRIESLQPKLAQGKLLFKKEHFPLINQLLLWDPVSKTNEDDEIDALAWQVGLWRRNLEDYTEPERARPGTFQEALEEITAQDDNWVGKLFEDFRQ